MLSLDVAVCEDNRNTLRKRLWCVRLRPPFESASSSPALVQNPGLKLGLLAAASLARSASRCSFAAITAALIRARTLSGKALIASASSRIAASLRSTAAARGTMCFVSALFTSASRWRFRSSPAWSRSAARCVNQVIWRSLWRAAQFRPAGRRRHFQGS